MTRTPEEIRAAGERIRRQYVARRARLRMELAAALPDMSPSAVPVGSKVWFPGERLGYTVQARDRRYLVCTKPFNPRRTVLYTVVDLHELVRGTENLVFCAGAETREDCEQMLERLNGRDPDCGFRTEVSHRNRVHLKVRRVRSA